MFLQVGAALGVRPVNLHWLMRRGQPRRQKSFGTASADQGQSRVPENALQLTEVRVKDEMPLYSLAWLSLARHAPPHLVSFDVRLLIGELLAHPVGWLR